MLTNLSPFLSYIRATKSKNTSITYATQLKNFDHLETIDINCISLLISEWKSNLVSGNTIKLRLMILKQYLDFTLGTGYDSKLKTLLGTYKANRSLPVIASSETVNEIIKSVRKPKYKLILLLLYHSSLRVSEVHNLNCGDIKDDHLIVRDSKGSKSRVVPISEYVSMAIKDYYEKVLLLSFPAEPLNTPLIRNSKGQRLTLDAIKQTIKRICVSNGVGQLSSHKFRHSGLTNLLHNGVDLNTIKEIAGHSDLKTTSIYLHTTQEQMISKLRSVYQ
jgi:integrase/recombinase XerD